MKRLEDRLGPPPEPAVSRDTRRAIAAVIELRQTHTLDDATTEAELVELLRERGLEPDLAVSTPARVFEIRERAR